LKPEVHSVQIKCNKWWQQGVEMKILKTKFIEEFSSVSQVE
jgi:hypothetical protein